MTTLIIFILVLSSLILIHELGHFLAAKLTGIKVEEFGLGLPPKILTLFDDGETKYTLNLLPIGGFVRLFGEGEEVAENQTQSFSNKSNPTRIFVLTSGVLMNYFLGVILISVVLLKLGVPKVENAMQIESISENSPAAAVNLNHEDLITGYKVTAAEKFQKIQQTDLFLDFINDHQGERIELLIIKAQDLQTDQSLTISLIPRQNPPEGEGPIGISFFEIPRIKYQPISWWKVPYRAVIESLNLTLLVFQGITNMFGELIAKGILPQDITGPVGIAKLTGKVAEKGFFQLLQITALISINLAVINFLPFPALDGGRLAFIVLEVVTGKKLNPRFEKWVHTLGMLALLLLISVITFYDIQRFF